MHASLLCFPWGARLVVMLPGELGWAGLGGEGDPRRPKGGMGRLKEDFRAWGLWKCPAQRADEDAQGCALLTLSISTTGDPTPRWDLVPGLHRSQWAESFPRGPL